MTSFHKPTPPGQESQEGTPPEKQEQQSLRSYMTPAGEKGQLEAGAQGAKPGTTPGSVPPLSPTPTDSGHLPAGHMPATYPTEQSEQKKPESSLPGSGLRSFNQFSPTPSQFSPLSPTQRSEAANNLRPPLPNLPGSGSGLLARPATSLPPPANAPANRSPHTQPVPQPFNPPNNGSGLAAQAVATIAVAPSQPPQQKDNIAQQAPEIVNGNIILYRSEHFYVRTAYRPGQRKDPLRKPSGNTQVIPRIMPEQGSRIAQSETRLLPRISPINPLKKERFPIPAWFEAIVITIALACSFVAHAVNLFDFPRYELDEGTYMSSAWAILNGQLTPYPYGYGHPPVAWMQIAAWIKLAGGFFAFGNAINSGRVLMIFFAAGSGLLTYMIIRRLEGNRTAGILALVIFSFSPLAITYQRQVLLDNVAIFWLLLSLYLLVVGNSRLVYIVSSALCFGIAILSKEVLLLFVPGMLYAVWLHTTSFQRKFALVAFTYTTIAFVSGFVLLALLKGELFPYEWHLPWDTHTHLSLIDTYLYQGSRTQTEGSFLGSLKNWVAGDKLFMLGSLGTMFLNLIVGWWRRKQLLMALLAISFWFLLVRGGVVFAFYLIPLIPLMAMNAAMAINMLFGWLGKLIHLDLVRVALILGVIAMLVQYDFQISDLIYTRQATATQNAALAWVRNNVPRNDFIVVNSYFYTDLHVPGGLGVGDGPPFPYAHIYVNVATDPELFSRILQNNWDRIDYIVADPEVLGYITALSATSADPSHTLKQAFDHSTLCAQFTSPDHDAQLTIKIYKVEHKSSPPMVTVRPGDTGTGTAATIGTNPIINRRVLIA